MWVIYLLVSILGSLLCGVIVLSRGGEFWPRTIGFVSGLSLWISASILCGVQYRAEWAVATVAFSAGTALVLSWWLIRPAAYKPLEPLGLGWHELVAAAQSVVPVLEKHATERLAAEGKQLKISFSAHTEKPVITVGISVVTSIGADETEALTDLFIVNFAHGDSGWVCRGGHWAHYTPRAGQPGCHVDCKFSEINGVPYLQELFAPSSLNTAETSVT